MKRLFVTGTALASLAVFAATVLVAGTAPEPEYPRQDEPTLGDVLDRAAGVTAVATATGADFLTTVTFHSEGRRAHESELRLFAEGKLSPDGEFFAGSTGYEQGHRLVVLEVATARRLVVKMPPGLMLSPEPEPYMWWDEGLVVVRMIRPDRPIGRDRSFRPLYLGCRVKRVVVSCDAPGVRTRVREACLPTLGRVLVTLPD